MKHPVELVTEFHRAFGHPVRTVPTVPSAEERLLSCKLIMEEAAEYCKAAGFPAAVFFSSREGCAFEDIRPQQELSHHVDIIEAADGLGDLNVVVNGASLRWGLPIAAIDEEIQRSNMSKLGADGMPVKRADGRILKGPNYFKPNIARVLARADKFMPIGSEAYDTSRPTAG